MAARWSSKLSPKTLDSMRAQIQAPLLIKRLQRFTFDDPDNAKGPRLTRTQAMVALALLRKVLPDVQSLEISSDVQSSITVQIVRFDELGQTPANAPLIEHDTSSSSIDDEEISDT